MQPVHADWSRACVHGQVMRQDILMCAQLGVDGVVLGMLTQNGDVDATQLSEFIALCSAQVCSACCAL